MSPQDGGKPSYSNHIIVEHLLVALSQPDMLGAPLKESMMSFIDDLSHLGIAETELEHALNDGMHFDTVKAAQALWPDTKGQQMLLEVTLADALMSEAKTATSKHKFLWIPQC